MATTRTFKVWRGDAKGGDFKQYDIAVDEGMVVLDVLHRIQAQQANDLALRWNCKAGKCGSCSMEINGKPKLACMTRMNTFTETETVTVQPLKTFPVMKDLVTDVSWNYAQNKRIPSSSRARATPTGSTGCTRRTSTACRSSGSASSATSARTSATSCVIATAARRTPSSARAS